MIYSAKHAREPVGLRGGSGCISDGSADWARTVAGAERRRDPVALFRGDGVQDLLLGGDPADARAISRGRWPQPDAASTYTGRQWTRERAARRSPGAERRERCRRAVEGCGSGRLSANRVPAATTCAVLARLGRSACRSTTGRGPGASSMALDAKEGCATSSCRARCSATSARQGSTRATARRTVASDGRPSKSRPR